MVRVYSIFTSLFSVMKDNFSVFFSSDRVYFGQNSPLKWNSQTFECLGENSPNSSCYIWNDKSVFLYFLHHSSMSWEISLLYFLSWNFIWLLQKEPTTVQNFRLLSAQVTFHEICTLIGYFRWKYIKFLLKKVWKSYGSWYQGVQNLKKNLFFVSKITRTWWVLIRAPKGVKNWPFDSSLLCKV